MTKYSKELSPLAKEEDDVELLLSGGVGLDRGQVL